MFNSDYCLICVSLVCMFCENILGEVSYELFFVSDSSFCYGLVDGVVLNEVNGFGVNYWICVVCVGFKWFEGYVRVKDWIFGKVSWVSVWVCWIWLDWFGVGCWSRD